MELVWYWGLELCIISFFKLFQYIDAVSVYNMIHLDPPTVTVYPEHASIVEGANVTLICNATGMPPPSIQWTKVSGVLSRKSVLTLNNVRGTDTPNTIIQYQCTATNAIGCPAFSVANVEFLGEYNH